MRTDRDNWDINTSVGSTALFVAASRALEATKPTPLAVDQYAEVFCRAAGGEWADLVAGGVPEHPLRSEEFGQYFVSFQGARTRYFDGYFGRAIEAGVQQVVILASGLDSRAYRLDWAPGTTIFELDQPLVHQFKHEVLAGHGAEPKASRQEISIDLREDWGKALQDKGFDPSAPSAWIVEGLLIYLPADAQERLFESIDQLAAPGSFVGIEQMTTYADVVFDMLVAGANESGDQANSDFFSLIYNEQRSEASTWFHCHGWDSVRTELLDYLNVSGRTVPEPSQPAWYMFNSISLVSAVKG
ncbi:putative S-adenosyl-L-methionine-dependent methyltransferase [Mycobacteroides stephanolepidis]|uniref:S-adenosyl-L-methionine-dependent methyltransferase n=1 Tax=[Mycobacterium] stephanolepidis TaxID=1520670 RepID=A0A1Z4F3Q6_9MYCO|nr:class I SAM-dependent methyltransferase [[Mycobacterium] stephanolepidis]BAX99817.1 putative S-adenosyl-L-methionine-dependent methyltransferase [[Mycobacterium] stephanolepidis]